MIGFKRLGQKKGFSLVELSIVIAIISIIVGMSLKGYGWVQSSKVSATAEQIRSIRSAAIQWEQMKGQTDYTGLKLYDASASDTLVGFNLLQASDVRNRFNGDNTAAADGTMASTLVVTSVVNNANLGGAVVTMVNGWYGAGTCTYVSADKQVKCTYADGV